MIRDALAETGRIALGRVVMHTRERLVALEPRDKGIIVYTLRMGDEVVQPKDAFEDIPTVKPDKQMIEIARKIIEQQEGAFEPEKFKDRYENALRDLIRRKEKGEKLVTAEPVEDDNVIDLMAALKKSLKAKGRVKGQGAQESKREVRNTNCLHANHQTIFRQPKTWRRPSYAREFLSHMLGANRKSATRIIPTMSATWRRNPGLW